MHGLVDRNKIEKVIWEMREREMSRCNPNLLCYCISCFIINVLSSHSLGLLYSFIYVSFLYLNWHIQEYMGNKNWT